VTTVCWVHRKRFCDIKALGVMYSKPSVCMGKYDSASERHLTRCENRPDFYDAGEQPQRSQEAILGSEYGHDYDATIDYGWGVGLASKPLLPYRCQAIMPSPTVSSTHSASPSVVLCWVRDKARTVTDYVTQASGYARIICFHSRQSAAEVCRVGTFCSKRIVIDGEVYDTSDMVLTVITTSHEDQRLVGASTV
jgi:hypothetical protein